MLRDAIDLNSVHRVLVIKLRHHGDVLLTSPVFTVLKNRAPHLEIDALVYCDTQDMLTLHPAISQVHCVDRKWKTRGLAVQARAEWALLSALRQRRYDLIIHLTEHNRGAWLAQLCRPSHAVAGNFASGRQLWKTAFSHFYALPRPGVKRHMVEVNLDALRRIGVYPSHEERSLVLVPGAAAVSRVDALLAQNGIQPGDFVHIHPTSRWAFKCWAADKMSALIDRLQAAGHRIVVTAAPSDEEMAMTQRILAPLSQPVLNLAGQLSLKELAALTAKAKLFVGMDSAPMHMAAAMGTPVVVLFGPSGETQWGPWAVPHRVVTSDHICRPCGYDGCGGGKVSECLEELPVDAVWNAVQELLAGQ